jgi:hypothetical protein
MSDLQAQFYVKDGQLKLSSKGYDGGRFTGVPNNDERRRRADIAAYEMRMSQEVNASQQTRSLAPVPAGHMTQPVGPRAVTEALPDPTAALPHEGRKRHGMHIGTLLRSRRSKNQAATATTAHNMGHGVHRSGRRHR